MFLKGAGIFAEDSVSSRCPQAGSSYYGTSELHTARDSRRRIATHLESLTRHDLSGKGRAGSRLLDYQCRKWTLLACRYLQGILRQEAIEDIDPDSFRYQRLWRTGCAVQVMQTFRVRLCKVSRLTIHCISLLSIHSVQLYQPPHQCHNV